EMTPCPGERLLEALVVERLHQVVERRDVERVDGEAIERGDEDRRGHRLGADGAHDVDPGAAGHLHVEEDEIGRERADRVDGGVAAVGGADDLDAALVCEQVGDALPRERLIVDDEDANQSSVGHVWKGRRMSATVPPPLAAESSKWARGPYKCDSRATV